MWIWIIAAGAVGGAAGWLLGAWYAREVRGIRWLEQTAEAMAMEALRGLEQRGAELQADLERLSGELIARVTESCKPHLAEMQECLAEARRLLGEAASAGKDRKEEAPVGAPAADATTRKRRSRTSARGARAATPPARVAAALAADEPGEALAAQPAAEGVPGAAAEAVSPGDQQQRESLPEQVLRVYREVGDVALTARRLGLQVGAVEAFLRMEGVV